MSSKFRPHRHRTRSLSITSLSGTCGSAAGKAICRHSLSLILTYFSSSLASSRYIPTSLTIENVLTMKMTMNLCCMEPDNADCTEDFEESANYVDLRVFTVAFVYSDVPLTSVSSLAPYKWGVAGPSVLNGSQVCLYVCMYFHVYMCV